MAKKEEDNERVQASTIAVRHVITPEEENLVEVSNIPIGAAHSLTMLQALEEHMDTVIEQIREMQQWYINRSLKRKYKGKDWRAEQKPIEMDDGNKIPESEALMEFVKSRDVVDMNDSFMHRFRHAFYQVSRGKEGKLLEILEVLSDTDLQTRSSELDSGFRSPLRSQ